MTVGMNFQLPGILVNGFRQADLQAMDRALGQSTTVYLPPSLVKFSILLHCSLQSSPPSLVSKSDERCCYFLPPKLISIRPKIDELEGSSNAFCKTVHKDTNIVLDHCAPPFQFSPRTLVSNAAPT